MPELPEVEVVKRSLKSVINNLKIKKVTVNTNKLRYHVDKKQLLKTINKKILSVNRRSKYLLINLEKNITILCHLGMTGKFFIVSKNKTKKTCFYYKLTEKDDKHNHIIFYLNKNIKLIYNDVRKFGFIKIVQSNNINKINHLKDLGPEPLSNTFNADYFAKYIVNKKRPIKNVLMDQKFVAGLGNIYVNEILFFCKLYPLLKINKINKTGIKRIVSFTKKILKKSIKEGGSSIKDFKDTRGTTGVFQQYFKVYGREGKNCLKAHCSGIIEKIIISNRSTFYCKSCQK